MILEDWLIYIVLAVIVIVILYIMRKWITTYNKFHYWYERAQEVFSSIDALIEQRFNELKVIQKNIKNHDIHEYKTLKSVVEARGGWSKDLELNEKVKLASQIENSYFKLQAVFEKYPDLKADIQHLQLTGATSKIESKITRARQKYNKVVRKYNYRTKKFPRSVVAKAHGFQPLDYFTSGERSASEERAPFKPEDVFDE